MGSKTKEGIGIQEAMDNLALIAGMDLSNPPPLGILKKSRFVTDTEEAEASWITEEGTEEILELLDLTYSAVYHHLLHLSNEKQTQGEDQKKQKGILSLMALIGESAQKIQAYLALQFEEEGTQTITERESYRNLQQLYATRFSTQFSSGGIPSAPSRASQDFEAIQRDQEYELFYILNEEGQPYFQADLVRNLKVNCDLGPTKKGEFEEDPLLKVRAMLDRDLQASAGQILAECHSLIQDFYAIYPKVKETDLAQSLSMALMALFLAANPRHLLQNASGKSCLPYFEDFHLFLRRALKTAEYQRFVAYPPDKGDKGSCLLLHLTHQLSKGFFCRFGGVKQEVIGLIHRTARKGEEIKQKEKKSLAKGDTTWNQLLLEDEKIRALLDKFPNGPLFKILDLIREAKDPTSLCFDPMGQENFPYALFTTSFQKKKIPILRIPSPTKQALIQKAEIVEEFRAFLRYLSEGSYPQKLLLINLQDRNSWKERARSRALEALQKNAEFNACIRVLTLPKNNPFYHQTEEFLNQNQAKAFIQTFQDLLPSLEEGGFSLPLSQKELAQFAPKALAFVHEYFFEKKNTLTRRNREDFIEIFYQLLILKCIETIQPDAIGFCCKDGVDVGPAAQAMFFGMLQLLKGSFVKKEEIDLFRWILYAPALVIRERAIDPERLHRVLSVLERIDGALSEKGKSLLKAANSLYDVDTWKDLQR